MSYARPLPEGATEAYTAWKTKVAMMVLTFVGILPASVLGCDNAEPAQVLARAQIELDRHRAWWEQARSPAYTFEYNVVCECSDHTSTTVKVTVVDGGIESVVSTGLAESALYSKSSGPPPTLPRYHTLDSLFGVIQDAITGEANQLSVRYHSELGYPRKIAIGYTVNATDDEYTPHHHRLLASLNRLLRGITAPAMRTAP